MRTSRHFRSGNSTLRILTGLFAAALLPSHAENAADPRALFEQAMTFLEAHDQRAALPLLEQARALAPDEPGVVWNLGIVYAELGQHEKALEAWTKMAQLEPGNWQVTAKQVQSLQALGRLKERDERIARLLDQRKKSRDPGASRQPWFCREQFAVDGTKVMAVEFFVPASPQRVYLAFLLLADDGPESSRFSLGSYDTTTSIARSTGEIGPMGRLYHLDFYEQGGHRTYGFFKKRPGYDELRERVVAILTQGLPSISSSTRAPAGSGAGPEPDEATP